MSTKIYHAWRCRPREFPAVLAQFHAKAFEYAAKEIRDTIKRTRKADIEREYAKFLKRDKLPHSAARRKMFPVRLALLAAKAASKSPFKAEPCDIDVALNVWFHKGHVYFVGYGDCWNKFHDFVPAGAEEYGYYNNTDAPAHLTDRQWAARGKTWDEIIDKGWDTERLTHVIIDADKETGLYELAKILLPKHDPYGVVP